MIKREKIKGHLPSVILCSIIIFFGTFSFIYGDLFDDAVELFDDATIYFEEAEIAYTNANELAEMEIEEMTIEELEEMTELYDEATEKFTSASQWEREANELMAKAELEYESELEPEPEPEPVLTEAEKAKNKARSKAIAMRARAKAKMLIDRTATEKKFIKRIQVAGAKYDLKVSNSGRGPFFIMNNSFDMKTTQYDELFQNELDAIVEVMRSYPVYHLKIRTFAEEYDTSKKNKKISGKRADLLVEYLEAESITKFDIEIETDQNLTLEGDVSNVIQLVFFREEGYFRR
ncbi:hypothetical protein KAU32_10885 [bacterium]|nr:hypothetical protein [bacterium]